MKPITTFLAAACAPVAMAAAIVTTNSFNIQKETGGCGRIIHKVAAFTFGPTKTVWTTTETVTQTVDCGECGRVEITQIPMGPGLVIFFENTTTVAEPSLTTTYVCDQVDEAQAPKTVESRPQETFDTKAADIKEPQAAEDSKEPTETEARAQETVDRKVSKAAENKAPATTKAQETEDAKKAEKSGAEKSEKPLERRAEKTTEAKGSETKGSEEAKSTSQPEPKASEPESKTKDSEPKASEPEPKTTEPESKTKEPAKTKEPEAKSTSQPETQPQVQPQAQPQQPQQPQAVNPQPEIPTSPQTQTTPHRLWSQPEAYVTTTITPQTRSTPICIAQTELDPPIPDSTLTVYPSTVTAISTIECFGCEWNYWTGAINFFAPVTLTSTITVNTPSTKIDLSCSASSTG